jgi:predicted Ser/Thr protein kinase
MQIKNLVKKNSVTLIDGKREVIKVIGTPFGPLSERWCRHEAGCLSKLAELGFEGAPKLIGSSGHRFTMEKIEGSSLNGRNVVDERLFRRVLDVVHQLHTLGFAHGNLRGSNILITDRKEPVLIDFETCCQKRNPLFFLVKFSDHVRLHLLSQYAVAQSDQERIRTLFPRHVTLAMYVITPINRLARALRSIKKGLRKARRISAEQRDASSARPARTVGARVPRQAPSASEKARLKRR